MKIQRGAKFIILFLVFVAVMSMTGLGVLYFLVSRAPAVATNSVLILSVPGDVAVSYTHLTLPTNREV